jgi:hypothetical protein
MEKKASAVYENIKEHQDLEWFRLPEYNTICPIFLCCSSKILEYIA